MKIMRYVMTLLIFCSLIIFNSSANAANIALLPLVNNVTDREDLGQIYFDRAVSAIKLVNEYDIVDSAELDKIISKYTQMNFLPDQKACQAIALEGNVDYILVMSANRLMIDEKLMKSDGDYVNLIFEGGLVCYNAVTGKFIDKKISEEDTAVKALMARYDISGNQFADSVTREVKKALGIKKFTVEKQRIGFKGDRK